MRSSHSSFLESLISRTKIILGMFRSLNPWKNSKIMNMINNSYNNYNSNNKYQNSSNNNNYNNNNNNNNSYNKNKLISSL